MITIKSCPKNPLNYIGEIAGICWNSDTSDADKNIKRAKSCIKSGHGRIMEYIDVVFIIEGFSARCIRELGRHVIGTTYLQTSTRYVNYDNFEYFNPSKGNEQNENYKMAMDVISDAYGKLVNLGMSVEDAANVLPLGMDTKIVWKINLRALIHFMNMRLCGRAYHEIRDLSNQIKKSLSEYSEEWKWICDNYFVPNCKAIGYCVEDKCCGLMPKGLGGLKEQWVKEQSSSSKSMKELMKIAVKKSPFSSWFYEIEENSCELHANGKGGKIEICGDCFSIESEGFDHKFVWTGIGFDELNERLNALYELCEPNI